MRRGSIASEFSYQRENLSGTSSNKDSKDVRQTLNDKSRQLGVHNKYVHTKQGIESDKEAYLTRI